MTDIPENVDWQWIHHPLAAVLNRLATLEQLTTDARDDYQGIREQLDVVVMTSLRLERSQAAIRQDIRELRQRMDRLETAK